MSRSTSSGHEMHVVGDVGHLDLSGIERFLEVLAEHALEGAHPSRLDPNRHPEEQLHPARVTPCALTGQKVGGQPNANGRSVRLMRGVGR